MKNPYLGSGWIDVKADAVVIDVGANIGDFTMQVAHACPQGKLYAIEPVSEHVRMIEIQKLLNGVSNVVCVHTALGGSEGKIQIESAGTHSRTYEGKGSAETVRLTTLPQIMREHGIERLDLLKLDCEGAEWDIFPAAEEILSRVDQICMEYHSGRGWTGEKLASWLTERGYTVKRTGEGMGLLLASRLKRS